jgi:hypothetical protein
LFGGCLGHGCERGVDIISRDQICEPKMRLCGRRGFANMRVSGERDRSFVLTKHIKKTNTMIL